VPLLVLVIIKQQAEFCEITVSSAKSVEVSFDSYSCFQKYWFIHLIACKHFNVVELCTELSFFIVLQLKYQTNNGFTSNSSLRNIHHKIDDIGNMLPAICYSTFTNTGSKLTFAQFAESGKISRISKDFLWAPRPIN